MQDCCRTGFLWDGKPAGKEETIGGHEVYITGTNSERGILFLHDAFGWQLNNNRILADHFAKEIDATVYLPDFFHGTAVDAATLSDHAATHKFDWPTWLKTNSVPLRLPAILSFTRLLRGRHSKLAAAGYCWGGKAAICLAANDQSGLLDCISVAHPSAITKEEVLNICIPVQILSPEHDPVFTQELKDFCNAEIPKLGLEYSYEYFPTMTHGFCTRCDMESEKEKKALERAKNAVVYWLNHHLR